MSERYLTFTVHYFKPSGKYYTTGSFAMTASTTEVEDGKYSVSMFDAVNALKEQFQNNKAPGLSGWNGGYYALVDHPEGYPCLIVP
jgi:hypothetical protein